MLYTVRLESQTDDQWREVTLDAESPALAKALARRQESDYVAFSLIPSEPAAPEAPDEGADATVWDAYAADLTRHERDAEIALRAIPDGEAALAALEARYEFDPSGRVVAREDPGGGAVAPSARARAHLHTHYQSEPYEVASVEPVVPNVDQVVGALKQLHEHGDYWQKVLDRLRDEDVPLGAVTALLAGLSWKDQIAGVSPWVWSSAAIQCSLHTAYTFDQDTHDFFNDASATEIAATGGYSANGVTLASKTSTYDTATDQVRLDAADAVVDDFDALGH
jgi:hypothetical protein